MKNYYLKLLTKVANYTFIGILCQFFLVGLCIASDADAQQPKSIEEVSIEAKYTNAPLVDIFGDIESQTDFVFTYDKNDSFLKERYTSKLEKTILADLFRDLSLRKSLIFQQINNNISVRTKRQASESSPDPIIAAIKITGKVTSSDGEPLPGVNVVVKGINYGTVTDVNGAYALEAEADATLILSFIGYQSKEVPVNGRSVIDVVMEDDITQLEEVVVVGYGAQKKANLTGSIAQIQSEEIASRSVNSTTQALQGLAPNLNVDVNSTGGAADASMSINVRGVGSLSSSSPYILIDGVRATGSELAALNPDVIQNISVLKDAAASAIYGAQAAYGVILIETKKGRRNQDFTLNYSNSYRLKKRIFVPASVNSVEYAKVLNDAAKNHTGQIAIGPEQMEKIEAYHAGLIPYQTEQDPDRPNEWLGIQKGTSNGWYTGYANNDWWDIMYKDLGFTQKHNISATGGGEKISFHIAGGYFKDAGQLAYGDENEHYSRYNFNSNISAEVTDWLKISNYTRFHQENNVFPATLEGGSRGRLYHDIMRFSPLAPYKTPAVRDDYGEIIIPEQLTLLPGFNENNGFNAYNDSYLVSTFKAEVEITPDLKVFGDFTFKRNFYDRTLNFKKWTLMGPDARPSITYQANDNQVKKDWSRSNYSTFNVYSRYKKSFAKKHRLELLVGYQQEENNYSDLMALRKDVVADHLNSLNVAVGEILAGNDMSHWATLGVFGRLKYNYEGKYLLEFNGRYDGSSRFAKENRFGFYPSVAAGYNIHRENFWEPVSDYVNTLKIRVSWGKLGNQQVGNYLYLANLPIRNQLAWAINGERPNYAGMPGIISPDITWETSITKNLGFDLSFLKSRLTTSIDVFERQTDNMFGPSGALPGVLGTSPPRTNSASLKTKGWEFIVEWTDETNDLRYDMKLLLSDNRTFITEYHNPEKLLGNYYEGQEIGEIWGYESDGLFQSVEEVNNYTSEVDLSYMGRNWQPGNVRYNDLNKDGKVNIGSNTLDDPGDRRIIGNSSPRYRVSFQGSLFWKNFDFNMFWQGIGKRDFAVSSYGTLFWGWNSGGHSRITKATLDYWSEENPGAYLPIPLEGGGSAGFAKDRRASTRYLQDASYIRLKSLNIGYTLPASLMEKLNIKKMRVYLSGENLLTFTKMWENFDPELATTGERSRTSVGRAYPLAQVYAMGVNITF